MDSGKRLNLIKARCALVLALCKQKQPGSAARAEEELLRLRSGGEHSWMTTVSASSRIAVYKALVDAWAGEGSPLGAERSLRLFYEDGDGDGGSAAAATAATAATAALGVSRCCQLGRRRERE